jgi:hypothetical protein
LFSGRGGKFLWEALSFFVERAQFSKRRRDKNERKASERRNEAYEKREEKIRMSKVEKTARGVTKNALHGGRVLWSQSQREKGDNEKTRVLPTLGG